MPEEDDLRLATGRRQLGDRLRRLRRDLLLKEVAERAGTSISYLSDIERGERLPTLPLLLKLADVYDVLLVEMFVDLYPWGTKTPPHR